MCWKKKTLIRIYIGNIIKPNLILTHLICHLMYHCSKKLKYQHQNINKKDCRIQKHTIYLPGDQLNRGTNIDYLSILRIFKNSNGATVCLCDHNRMVLRVES